MSTDNGVLGKVEVDVRTVILLSLVVLLTRSHSLTLLLLALLHQINDRRFYVSLRPGEQAAINYTSIFNTVPNSPHKLAFCVLQIPQ